MSDVAGQDFHVRAFESSAEPSGKILIFFYRDNSPFAVCSLQFPRELSVAGPDLKNNIAGLYLERGDDRAESAPVDEKMLAEAARHDGAIEIGGNNFQLI